MLNFNISKLAYFHGASDALPQYVFIMSAVTPPYQFSTSTYGQKLTSGTSFYNKNAGELSTGVHTAKTDQHGLPPSGFCARIALSPSNYIFALTSVSLKGFSLFVRDDRKFCKNCFQQRAIGYQTSIFLQNLFEIVYY